MISLNENSYVYGFWFCQGKDVFDEGQDVNWFCGLTKENNKPWTMKYRFRYFCGLTKENNKPWTMKYRFKYLCDNKAFDSKDKKNWYAYSINKQNPTDIIIQMKPILDAISNKFDSEMKFVDLQCQGDDEKIAIDMACAGFCCFEMEKL